MAAIRVGICGLGFVGKIHFHNYLAMKGVKVTAIADTDPLKRQGKWTETKGNLKTCRTRVANFSSLARYAKIEDLIGDPQVDVVDITLPTPLHLQYALKALEAGKPVICEKPLALTSSDAQQLGRAFAKRRAPLFVAHCIRFWPEYVVAKKIVDSGAYGRVLQANFTRLSIRPAWSWDNWVLRAGSSGSAALDLHIHDSDFICHLLGRPATVSSYGTGFNPNVFEHIVTIYGFKGRRAPLVTAEGGWMAAPGFGFTMNFRIELEKATLVWGWGRTPKQLTMYTRAGKVIFPKLPAGDGYSRELAYFIDCLRKKKAPAEITPDSAVFAIRLVEAEARSARAGGKQIEL